ncbi:MAG: hypothetical protein KA275_08680 [Chitinophagaceae bacterium]|nr:hypothetical protein [Chitinophagaceae bacterium]
MKLAKIIYIILKLIITLSSCYAMFFAIAFNMLSKDKLDIIIADNFWNFFFLKILIGIIIGLVFFLLSILINLIFRNIHDIQKKTIIKLAIVELLFCIIFAMISTIIIFG